MTPPDLGESHVGYDFIDRQVWTVRRSIRARRRQSHVGYDFIDRQGCEINQVQQLVAGFDLEWLRDARHYLHRAELLFGERIIHPTVDTPRSPAGKYTCLIAGR